MGNVLAVTDSLGNRNTNILDTAGRNSALVDARPNRCSMTYDAAAIAVRHSLTYNYLGSKKHGIKWTEGKSTATRPDSNGNLTHQGQWRSIANLDWAGQQAATLAPGEGKNFDLPANHSSIVWEIDGVARPAKRVWLRNNGTGTFHGYPKD